MIISVRPSVCHTFLTMFPSSYHHEIFRSYYQWQKWRPCKRSRSEVKGQGHTQLSGFRTVTPVWIHIWWWNDAYSLMLLRRGALFLTSSVKFQGHAALKLVEFDPDWGFPDSNSTFEFTNGLEMMHKAWSRVGEVPYCFSRSSVKFHGRTALKIVEFNPNWAFPDWNSGLNSPMGTKWCTKLEVAQKRCPIVL